MNADKADRSALQRRWSRSCLVGLLSLLFALGPAPGVWAHEDVHFGIGRATAYAQQREGRVSFAVVNTDGRLQGRYARRGVPTASVLKVMFMVAYLRLPEVRGRALRSADRRLLEPMIRRSDNATATAIANRVGPARMRNLARISGMKQFHYTRPWGATTTSARDQARFMFSLHHYLPERHWGYAIRLLRRVTPPQRWGIGQVQTPGWRQFFKGGWGSGTGAVEHQVVRLRDSHGHRLGLAVMIENSPNHAYGKHTLKGMFRRLLRHLPQ